MPAGYKIPAHWHPTDEQVTVLSGTLALGMGDKLDKTKGQTLKRAPGALEPSRPTGAHMNHPTRGPRQAPSIQISIFF